MLILCYFAEASNDLARQFGVATSNSDLHYVNAIYLYALTSYCDAGAEVVVVAQLLSSTTSDVK